MRNWLIPGLLVLIVAGCGKRSQERRTLTAGDLSTAACGSCHVMPDPEDLPKQQWETLLPYMGLRLGIKSEELDPFKSFKFEETRRVLAANVFPNEQLLEDSLWAGIQQYFIENAPDSFQLSPRNYPVKENLFVSKFPQLNIGGSPFISMVRFDAQGGDLYLADWGGKLIRLDSMLEIEAFTSFPMPVVDIAFTGPEGMLALSIGELYPNDRLTGAVARLDGEKLAAPSLVFEDLARPVQFTSGDIDGDGREDLLICNFGNYVGDLTWYQNNGESYVPHVIKNVPGATRAFLRDLDSDGDLDIVALFAQGDEGVSLFYNSDGSFSEERVLRFNPLYGSNDMVINDIDNDGDFDIIMSNGDNGDHTITLKPYHGVRVFVNDGTNAFTENYFQPLYGSSKVRVEDFDLDGDKDIIAASFFPDTKSGLDQSIIYMENAGDLTFEVYSVAGAGDGRWMVMDTGDFDRDGDVDVIVGSFTLAHEGIDPGVLSSWRQSGKYILAMENQTISR